MKTYYIILGSLNVIGIACLMPIGIALACFAIAGITIALRLKEERQAIQMDQPFNLPTSYRITLEGDEVSGSIIDQHISPELVQSVWGEVEEDIQDSMDAEGMECYIDPVDAVKQINKVIREAQNLCAFKGFLGIEEGQQEQTINPSTYIEWTIQILLDEEWLEEICGSDCTPCFCGGN
mgnify:CR=1 FL=1